VILHGVCIALAAYCLGVLALVLVGSVWLTVFDEMDALAEDFDTSHRGLRSFAWRWPVTLPLATVTVVGITAGLALCGLGRLYRRIMG